MIATRGAMAADLEAVKVVWGRLQVRLIEDTEEQLSKIELREGTVSYTCLRTVDTVKYFWIVQPELATQQRSSPSRHFITIPKL